MHIWETKLGTKVIRLNIFKCSCYFIMKDNYAVLIDTSIKAERFIIENSMKKLGITKLIAIVLTHNNFDHAGNVEFLRKKYNCSVIIHKNDYEGLENGYTDLPNGMHQPFKSFTNFINSKEIILPTHRFTPFKEARAVGDDESLNKFGINAVLLPTPGHTEGSLTIVVDNEIALVGDLMFHNKKYEVFPPFAKRPDEVVRSWIKLLDTGCQLILPAHGHEISLELLRNEIKANSHYIK